MVDKICVITIGPESSGNRLVQNLLVKSGLKGTTGYEQPFLQDFDLDLPEASDVVVGVAWLRSIPHATNWYINLHKMVYDAIDKGYCIGVIITERDPLFAIESRRKRWGDSQIKALHNIIKGRTILYRLLDPLINQVDFTTIVSYESLVEFKTSYWNVIVDRHLAQYGASTLPMSYNGEIYNGNTPYLKTLGVHYGPKAKRR